MKAIEIMNSTEENVGLLVDVAHLKVSSQSEGFCKNKYLESTAEFTFAYHFSDNDGKSDTNEVVNSDSWFWPFVRKDLNYYSLEVYNEDLNTLKKQIDLVKKKFSKMNKHPTITVTQSVRECMTIIDRYAKRISFVLENEILVGVVTDGDVRRALLNGTKLEDPVESIMNKEFVSFTVGSDSRVIRERFSKRIRHIPLVNDIGSLVDVADPRGNFRISVLEPSMQGNELNYVSECIKTNWISSQGKFVSQFEKSFEDFHPKTYALSVSNGTVALHLAIIALGIEKGDEVIVPDLTFAASANAVIHAGATPVFCEVDPETWCIDPKEAEKLIGPKTKAIMPVHLYGHPCEMQKLQSICEKYKILMIEDCAEALGSEWNGQKAGTFGNAATFSFFGNKTISTGEGGMILFKDSEVAEKARILRDHGMSKNKRYWHDVVGYNYRLTNLQAAIGVAQMENFQKILEKKLRISQLYNLFLKELMVSTNYLLNLTIFTFKLAVWNYIRKESK